jgi:Flp pilus assembly protein TadG
MKNNRPRQRGHSVLEMALMAPWFFLAFAGALDSGFYGYALIATQTAARAAALYTSSSAGNASDSTGACNYALDALRNAPNVGTGITTCTSLPVQVSASSVTGPDGAAASQVSVTYQTTSLIPIPGLLTNQLTFTRIVTMRVQE